MLTAMVIVHILVALCLIGLVLVQDAKGGGALGIGGGGGSNSILGATGAQTLAAKMTRTCAVIFALSCIWLAREVHQSTRSVIDSMPLPAPAASPAPSALEPASPGTNATATATDPAASPQPGGTPAPDASASAVAPAAPTETSDASPKSDEVPKTSQ